MSSEPATASQDSKHKLSFSPAWRFAVHVIVGTLVFTIIAAGAIALDLITARLEPLGIDHVIMYGLKGAEYALFVTDLLLFVVFLAKIAARAIRSL